MVSEPFLDPRAPLRGAPVRSVLRRSPLSTKCWTALMTRRWVRRASMQPLTGAPARSRAPCRTRARSAVAQLRRASDLSLLTCASRSQRLIASSDLPPLADACCSLPPRLVHPARECRLKSRFRQSGRSVVCRKTCRRGPDVARAPVAAHPDGPAPPHSRTSSPPVHLRELSTAG